MAWWKSLFKVFGKGLSVASKRFIGLFTFLWSQKRIVTIVGILILFFTPAITTFINEGVREGAFQLGRNLFLPDYQIQQIIGEIQTSAGQSWWEAVKLRGALLAPLTTLGVVIYGVAKLFNMISNVSPFLTIFSTLTLLGIFEVIFVAATQDFTGLSPFERIGALIPFRGIGYDLWVNILLILDPFLPFFDAVTNVPGTENSTSLNETVVSNSTFGNGTNMTN